MNQPPRRGVHALASMLPRVTAPIFKSRGFAEAGILTDWPAIVGPYLAAHCMPEKISFPRGARSAGTLHVVSESAFAPELQHVEPQLLERINGYFGYGAVCRLRIQHGRVLRADQNRAARARPGAVGLPAARPGTRPGLKPAGQKQAASSSLAPEATAGMADDPLRAALERLGQAIQDRALAKAESARDPAPASRENDGSRAAESRGNPGKSPGSR